jgi:hypothetical protein
MVFLEAAAKLTCRSSKVQYYFVTTVVKYQKFPPEFPSMCLIAIAAGGGRLQIQCCHISVAEITILHPVLKARIKGNKRLFTKYGNIKLYMYRY